MVSESFVGYRKEEWFLMRISDLLRLGREYLLLGVIAVVIVLLCFLVVYFILYKKILKGKKIINIKSIVWWGIFLCYIVIVAGVTLMNRGSFWSTGKIQPLFYSYRDAWVHYSDASWRNIILNFCMFIPLGFWVPLGVKWFRKFWRTYLVGFLFSLVIEITQLLLHRGMFELDDLLGNTAGTMIGYGLFTLFIFIAVTIKKDKQSRRLLLVILLQLPLFITVCSFGIIFGIYASMELGNNPYRYIGAYDKGLINVSSDIELSDENINLPTYKIPTLTVGEAREMGSQLFQNLGTTIDESRTDVYDDTLVLYSSDSNRYSLWIEYKGGSYKLTDFNVLYPETEEESKAQPILDASENIILTSLKEYGVAIPDDCKFKILDNGQYNFTANMIETGNSTLNGTINCTYYGERGMGTINNAILTCIPYKEYAVISEQKAYEKIANGEFGYSGNETLDIEVKSCTLSYEIDSKGYYQPTYQFEALINGQESQIMIPAYE